jgi:flagellar export protein FliJ
MAFRYSLQSVLRLRQSMERQEEQRLLAIAAMVVRLRAEIEEFQRARLEAQRADLQEMTAGCSGAALQFAAICEAAAAGVHRRLQSQLLEAERQRLQQRDAYQRARQEREIFEGLRERQETAHERELAHREQERADEAYLIRYFGDSPESFLPGGSAKPAHLATIPRRQNHRSSR